MERHSLCGKHKTWCRIQHMWLGSNMHVPGLITCLETKARHSRKAWTIRIQSYWSKFQLEKQCHLYIFLRKHPMKSNVGYTLGTSLRSTLLWKNNVFWKEFVSQKSIRHYAAVFFSVTNGIFFNGLKKSSQPGHNVRKSKLVNTFSARFKTITRQTVEMTQRK